MGVRAAIGLAFLLAAPCVRAQNVPPQLGPPPGSRLPPTLPTQPGALAASPITAAPAAKPSLPEHRARVLFAGRTLQVNADNSSLNGILREIERLTGLKITGGVQEERVYGTYGPAETSAVLTALLGGTGSNMLLIVDRNNMPTELVLTPRQGGPTPPSPNAARIDDDRERDRERDDRDTPPQLSQHTQRPPAPPPPLPPQSSQTQPAQVQATPPSTPAQPAAAGTTTTDQAPNGVKTPQQIYDQLLKLQQQQQKTPAGTNPP